MNALVVLCHYAIKEHVGSCSDMALSITKKQQKTYDPNFQ